MNVLTDEEIDIVLGSSSFGGMIDARKIEYAVIKKLAVVSVEPSGIVVGFTRAEDAIVESSEKLNPAQPIYTFSKLAEAIAAARVQAINECAKVCEGISSYLEHQQHLLASRDCANAIRALIGK